MPTLAAPYPSGKGAVCKTAMQRFEPARRLQATLPTHPRLFMRSLFSTAKPGDKRFQWANFRSLAWSSRRLIRRIELMVSDRGVQCPCFFCRTSCMPLAKKRLPHFLLIAVEIDEPHA